MTGTFFGNFDLASLSIWLFWLFLAILIYYLQTENMREGYPLEDDDGVLAANQGPFPVPKPKTFKLPHGRGEVSLPGPDTQRRDELALRKTGAGNGFPFEPTGDPLVDGVGPASWANRRDVPELDGQGHPMIVPMSHLEGVRVTAGRDPRGKPVMSGDGELVGTVTEIWVDEPEKLARYLQYDLDPKWGQGTRLVPMQLAVIKSDHVKVRTLYAKQFANVPQSKSMSQITLLEEEKICAYYAGGVIYASADRLEPQI